MKFLTFRSVKGMKENIKHLFNPLGSFKKLKEEKNQRKSE